MAKEGVWIPIEIWNLSELTLLERYIYSDIKSFFKDRKSYFKSNSRLAEECKSSTASITRAIANLIKLKHIRVKQMRPIRTLEPSNVANQIDESPNQIDESPNQIDQSPNQIDESPNQIDEHISKGISKVINKGISKVIIAAVVFPFQEIEFLEAWDIWKDERKQNAWKKYSSRAEQSALHKLQKISNNDYRTAINIINESISQGWRGLFALKGSKQVNTGHNLEEAVAWAYKKR